jgi:hypothetical protein
MRIFNFLKSNNNKHRSLRVRTDIGEKFINVEFGQTYESLDILSLKVFQKDLYRLFDSDYGVIVGRVTGSGVGLPNCRVSIFVPLDETDVTSPTTLEDIKKIEALSVYPYQTVFDKDENGKIYNLLPKYSRNRNFNNFPDNELGIGATPKTPVGTFPEKEEVLINETVAYVYDKYLKFTTITNESGDYILTVPANRTYTVTMCSDITDIGKFSTTPALLKLEGYPDSFFTEDGTRINDQLPLETLPNIDIQNISQYVKPLWSQDDTNTNVGINRLDFKLSKQIKPFFTVFGNYFTPNNRSWWGDRIIFRLYFALYNLCIGCPQASICNGDWIGLKIEGKVCIDWLSVSRTFGFTIGCLTTAPDTGCNSISFCFQVKNIVPWIKFRLFQDLYCTLNGGRNDYDAFHVINYGGQNACSVSENNFLESIPDELFIQSHIKGNLNLKPFTISNTIDDPTADILNDPNTSNNDQIYTQTYSYDDDINLVNDRNFVLYQNNGSFITLINCNRNKVVTDENGDLLRVSENNPTGVFIGFRGYFYITNDAVIDNPPSTNRTGKIALKVPQSYEYGPNYQTKQIFQSLPTPQYPNRNKWIWEHYSFEAGKLYSIAQYNYVKKNSMSTENEQKEDLDSLVNIFDTNTWDNPYDSEGSGTANGFEEQTNILYFGARDVVETQNLTTTGAITTLTVFNQYIRNSNSDYKYLDMYNHVTIPGADSDPNLGSTTVGGQPPGGTPAPTPPPPPAPPAPSLTVTLTSKIESKKNSSSNNTIQSIFPNSTINTQRFLRQGRRILLEKISQGNEIDEEKYNEYLYSVKLKIDNLGSIGTIQNVLPSINYKLYAQRGNWFGGLNYTLFGNSYLTFETGNFTTLQNNGHITADTDNTLYFSLVWDYNKIQNFTQSVFGFRIDDYYTFEGSELKISNYTGISNDVYKAGVKIPFILEISFNNIFTNSTKFFVDVQLLKEAVPGANF